METKMKLKDLKGVRMYVFQGSKTGRKSICQEQKTLGAKKPSKGKDEQLEKVRDLEEN